MEKSIALRNTDITFSIWDLGGQAEYLHMLPLVCNDAVALLFMFDLSRKSTLTAVKQWYKQSRLLNKTALPFLVGTKYDYFCSQSLEERAEVSAQARKFARAMKAPLLFCSASHSINVHKLFKVVLSKVFDLKCNVEQITGVGEPLIEYDQGTNDSSSAATSEKPTNKSVSNSVEDADKLAESTGKLTI